MYRSIPTTSLKAESSNVLYPSVTDAARDTSWRIMETDMHAEDVVLQFSRAARKRTVSLPKDVRDSSFVSIISSLVMMDDQLQEP